MATITVRKNWGSMPEVIRVFAYDQSTGDVLCLLKFKDAPKAIEQVPFKELEAIDPNGKFHDLNTELTFRAEYLLRHN